MQPQQQQPHPAMSGSVPSHFPLASITTEQIQKYLDENKQLILAILDNQNLGKLSECAQYQAQLQKNLLYLAAIADAQPQIPAVRAQTLPHPGMQQAQTGTPYMQQQPVFSPRPPSAMPFNPVQQMQLSQPQFHRPPQLVPMDTRQGIDNGEASLGMSSGGSARASAEERGGGGGDREQPPPSSSSLQKVS
ncbi:unnamed protein product [Spirodela intermedia]|uniref:SS18 N-terminal domain-containing protein n=1 Tax=Spirodela intermedia TaxID=51605 RepID=A0A7I8KEB7_SPIIN|nr:unnamed protein product [Spirodela intermedia]